MNEDELKALVDQYIDCIADENGKFDYRVLMLLAREVERVTRHKCVAAAYTLANNINNLNK